MKNNSKLRSWLDDLNLDHPLVIAGPCSAETESQVLQIAHDLKNSDVSIFRAGIWKPRTRPGNFEGVGSIGLKWLQKVKKETGLLITTEVANANHVKIALDHDIDVLWILEQFGEAFSITNSSIFEKHREYETIGACYEDLQLIRANCYEFHHHPDPTAHARRLDHRGH